MMKADLALGSLSSFSVVVSNEEETTSMECRA